MRARALGLKDAGRGQEDQVAMIHARSMPTGDFPNRVDCPSDNLQRPQIIKVKRTQYDLTMMDAVMVDEGLLIPKSLLTKLGTENLEVLTRGREIVIRPKSKIKQYCGFVGETEYDEEFIKELERDFAESGDI